ncbi:MAG: SRPBCC family protein [Acidimicrobiales bacterium]
MAIASGSILVERPSAEVFSYLADPRTHHEWQPDLLRTELVTDGEIGVGTRGVEVRRLLGREIRAPFQITRREPPTRQEFHTTGGPVRPDGTMRCESIGEATKVTYEFQLHGPMGRLLARVIGKGLCPNLARLKERLEAGT